MELSGGKGGRDLPGDPIACLGGEYSRAGWGWESVRAWQDAQLYGTAGRETLPRAAGSRHTVELQRG